MSTIKILVTACAFAAWAALAPSAAAQAPAEQDHKAHHPEAAAAATDTAHAPVPGMKDKHDKMMAGMKTQGAKLDALVAKMSAATGAARTEAIVALLTALVDEHKAMCEEMMQMAEPMSMMPMHEEMMKPADRK